LICGVYIDLFVRGALTAWRKFYLVGDISNEATPETNKKRREERKRRKERKKINKKERNGKRKQGKEKMSTTFRMSSKCPLF
jgi:hypothetical protein